MPDETVPEATAAPAPPGGDRPEPTRHDPDPRDAGPAPAGGPAPDETGRLDGGPGEAGAGGPGLLEGGEGGGGTHRKRRRRGSRGGRNRRRPAGSGAGSAAATPAEGTRPAGAAHVAVRHEDYTDPDADRGLTSEDLAADAREEAGLPVAPEGPRVGDRRPAPDGPKIGDTRPATASSTPGEAGARTGARRRRRGGRGRGGAGGGGGAGAVAARAGGAPADVVRADVSLEGEPAELADELAELDEVSLERRRGRVRKGRPAGRYLMCIHTGTHGHVHVAVLEGRSLVEYYVSSPRDPDLSIDGNIYLGRVQNVLPGMEAAFVDIGTPKNGVLYRGDVTFDKDEVEGSQPRIERLLKNGQSVVVQVTKNPIGAKGARLTQEVSLAGRFVVMVPGQPDTYGISKRLPDDERRRLRRVLEGLRPPDAGLIVRTAAEGATAEELERDVRRLRQQWEQISALAARSKPARLLYQEPALAVRLLREEFTKEYRGVVIDGPELYEEVRSYVEAVAPELAERVELYDPVEEQLPMFERFHVQEQLVKALDRKVWLRSGGSLVIERTEALTVIDVNTGKNVGRSNLEETVFRNNLEAAEEIARQLRLRDIGGIIVIDFIDMEIKENRAAVERAFREALARDKTRTQVFEISELGLAQMTRKRISEGLVESVSSSCAACDGRGFVFEESLMEELR